MRWWDGNTWTTDVQALGQPQPIDDRPPMRLIRSAKDAEMVAAEWMVWMGMTDARCTPTGPDGGLDVVSSHGVAQVKLHGRPIGRPELQKLHGASLGLRTLFFAAEGYTHEALAWAGAVDMALFRFDRQGVPTPVNRLARVLMAERNGGWPSSGARGRHASLKAFPLGCTDQKALSVVTSKAGGILSKKQTVTWMAQTWLRLYHVVIDYTHEAGWRKQIHQDSTSSWFSSLTGQQFPLKVAPGDPVPATTDPPCSPMEPDFSA